jgi:uncharacterized membrane protein
MKYRMATALLSLAGFFVALYLYLFKIGIIGTLACGAGGCETVQASPYSRFIGVEVALYGVVGYLALFVLSLVALQRTGADRRVPGLLCVMSGLGLGFTVYLTYIELFVIHAICRWCVSSAVIISLIFVTTLLDWRRGSPTATRGNAPAGR